MADVYHFPDGNKSNDAPAWLPYMMNNGNNNGWGGGLGGGILGFLLGILIGRRGLNGLFGGDGGNNGSGAGFISNQMDNESGRQLIMQAINSQGEQSRQAIQTLSTMLGQDFTTVSNGIQQLSSIASTIAANQGMNVQQIINALQMGNQTIISQFQQCCCQNQLAMANLQGAMNAGFQSVNGEIKSKAAEDKLNNCQLRYDLTQNDNNNTRAIIAKLDQIEDSRKDREIAALTAQLAEQKSANATAAIVNGAVGPLLGQIAALKEDVAAIKRCQPPTVTLPNNQYTAVPTLLANAGSDFIASYWANRLSSATGSGTTTGGTTGA